MTQLKHIPENLENLLSERIKYLYEYQLQHQLRGISYQIFDNKLMMTIEGAVTPTEQILNDTSQEELAKKVRAAFDEIIQPQIKQIIEEVFGLNVVDFLSDTTIHTSRTAIIAIFQLK
ncbi:MAG: Na-translocating system protein MpsC family protein [Microcoleaceae cyanobacterium]